MSKSLSVVKDYAENGIFTTIKGDSIEDRMKLFSAVNDAEKLADHIGETLTVSNLVVQQVDVTDETTGEISQQPRVIIITPEGKAYSAISVGLLSSVKNIVSFLGDPNDWPLPLTFKVVEKRGRNGYRFMTLELATKAKKGK